ncbi:MAG: methylated-DNA--[protein]-cysteine S-methyltransferase [Acidimicrobiales bacterium]
MRSKSQSPNRERAVAASGIETLRVPSPLGDLLLGAGENGLRQLVLPGTAPSPELDTPRRIEDGHGTAPHTHLVEAATQLGEYFAGARQSFDLVLELRGTEFQQRVWRALAGIGYGTTISYAELARRVGRPKAYRAAGQANGRNPLAIILPCHRVIAAGGSIGGYGGGLDMKRWLLALERAEGPYLRR